MYQEYYAATVAVNVTVFLALAFDRTDHTGYRDQTLRAIATLFSFAGVLLGLPALLPTKTITITGTEYEVLDQVGAEGVRIIGRSEETCVGFNFFEEEWVIATTGGIALIGLTALLANLLLRRIVDVAEPPPTPPGTTPPANAPAHNPRTFSPKVAYISVGALTLIALGLPVLGIIAQVLDPPCAALQ